MVIRGEKKEKSSFGSVALPAWWIGTFPEARVMLGAYEGNFAAGFGRATMDIMRAVGEELYGLKIRADQDGASDWAVEWVHPADKKFPYTGGGMMTAGRGGGFTGKAADLIIVDDPIKNAVEAMSKKAKEEVWQWWQEIGRASCRERV